MDDNLKLLLAELPDGGLAHRLVSQFEGKSFADALAACAAELQALQRKRAGEVAGVAPTET